MYFIIWGIKNFSKENAINFFLHIWKKITVIKFQLWNLMVQLMEWEQSLKINALL